MPILTLESTVLVRKTSLTYGLFDPEHCTIDGDLTLFLYFGLFGLCELFQFTTNGKEQDDRFDRLGDEVEKLIISSATTALNLGLMHTYVVIKAINIYKFSVRGN